MKQVCEERYESALVLMTLPLTKHVDSSKDDVDNACLNDPGLVLVSVDSMVCTVTCRGICLNTRLNSRDSARISKRTARKEVCLVIICWMFWC
ncbi:hypothetical protein BHM03_00013249, partial [Ensete ventricosum]